MAKKSSITEIYEALPKILKIILQIFLGGVIGGVYRIIRFVEKKNVVTLVAGIIALCTGIGNLIAWICDLYTEITANRITVLAN